MRAYISERRAGEEPSAVAQALAAGATGMGVGPYARDRSRGVPVAVSEDRTHSTC